MELLLLLLLLVADIRCGSLAAAQRPQSWDGLVDASILTCRAVIRHLDACVESRQDAKTDILLLLVLLWCLPRFLQAGIRVGVWHLMVATLTQGATTYMSRGGNPYELCFAHPGRHCCGKHFTLGTGTWSLALSSYSNATHQSQVVRTVAATR